MKVAMLLLALVVAVSGCTEFGNLFGGDVINVQEKTVENGERDVIIVKDIQTIPSSPLLPDQQVGLSFILENRDKLGSTMASVDLFNAPTMHSVTPPYELCNLYTGVTTSVFTADCGGAGFSCVSNPGDCVGTVYGKNCAGGNGYCCQPGNQNGGNYNQRICKPDQCGLEGCVILPGEEKPVNFVFKTPSESDIKGIKTSTKLDFKTVYKFSGSLNYIVPAVSSEEIVKRQRTGEKIDLQQTKSYSSGPVQIDSQILGAPFLLSNGAGNIGGTPSPDTIITFTIRNRGSGTVLNSQIDAGAMEIEFPPEFEVVPGDKFTCGAGNQGTTLCKNSRMDSTGKDQGMIPIYRDESRSAIRFTVKLRQALTEPFRSYQITAHVNYDYELRNSYDVTINPFQNV